MVNVSSVEHQLCSQVFHSKAFITVALWPDWQEGNLLRMQKNKSWQGGAGDSPPHPTSYFYKQRQVASTHGAFTQCTTRGPTSGGEEEQVFKTGDLTLPAVTFSPRPPFWQHFHLPPPLFPWGQWIMTMLGGVSCRLRTKTVATAFRDSVTRVNRPATMLIWPQWWWWPNQSSQSRSWNG